MRGDYSRFRFRPSDHYNAVRLQQGRVQLDADWNELIDIQAHRDEQTALDVIGPSGFPLEGGGFALGTGWHLRGISFHAELQGVAVGEDAAILRSTDGGAVWTAEDAPAGTGHLSAVHSLADDDAWAVGDAGTILHFTGGAWSAETGTTATDLNALLFADTTNGWAVGDGATVLRHGAGGWTAQPTPDTTADLHDVAAVSPSRAWIVGVGATILARTADDTAWASQHAPAGTGDLFGVWFLLDGGVERGWAVGAGGTIIATADGGVTWTEQVAPKGMSATLRDIRFFDAQTGVIAGDEGTILVTYDGGATWNAAASPAGGANLRSLCIIAPKAHAAGDGVVLNGDAALQAWTQGELPDPGRTLTIAAGDGYVEGVRVSNERTVSFAGQPDAPGARLPADAGVYAAYLRVAEHHVTAVEREELREIALGGPDTATRTQLAWSVELRATGDATCPGAEAGKPEGRSSGRLRARSELGEEAANECMVPIGGGFRRLENQLYRVEILEVATSNGGGDGEELNGNGNGSGDVISFTWSRDNGSVAMRLVALDGANNAVKVADIPDDELLGLAPKQWIEISDETRALRGERGLVAQIKSIEGDVVVVEEFGPRLGGGDWTTADFPLRPTVRRWDGRDAIDAENDWQPLESGVQVQFDGGSYRPGDYWTIPARTLAGDVDWHRNGVVPLFEEPHGELLRWAALGVVERADGGAWTVLSDCRKLFPPLTGMVHLCYVGGDGQEVMPDTPLAAASRKRLPQMLEVGVANGHLPVPNATVTFAIVSESGEGKVQLGDGALEDSVQATTDDDGIAACWWWLDGLRKSQQVEARLEDPLGQAPPAVIRFNGGLSYAEEVAYDGTGCGALGGQKTVQDAIDRMARLVRIFPLSGSGEDILPGQSVAVRVLVADDCGVVNGATVKFERGSRGTGSITDVKSTTEQGVAGCTWTPDGQTPTQDLVATVTAVPAGRVIHQPATVQFVANLNLARDTQYTPPQACHGLEDITNVQDAIDWLAQRLPRLYHVSGDGVEASVGATIVLRAGIANRCSIKTPLVRFERTEDDNRWVKLADVPPDSEGIATHVYTVGDDEHQLVRAWLLTDAAKPIGYPVYFNVGVSQSASGLLKVSVLNVSCVQGPPLGTAFSKVADIGSFSKVAPGSLLEIVFEGRIFVASFEQSASGAIFELRVDDRATQMGWARAALWRSLAGGNGVQASITGIFENLGAGTHTISMWAFGAFGSGTGPMVNPGCWTSDQVIVKEYASRIEHRV